MKKTWLKLSLFALLSLSSTFLSNDCRAEGPRIWTENDGGLLSSDYLTNGKIKVYEGWHGAYDLKDLIKDNPTALALAEKHMQFNTFANLSFWLGVIPSASVFGYGIGSNKSAMTIVSAVTFLATTLLTSHFNSQSRHYMNESINVYNGIENPKLVSSNENASKNPFPLSSSAKTIELTFHF